MVFAQHNNVPFAAYFVLPILLLVAALRLIFKWRDSLFLLWGAPAALALLAATFYMASKAGQIAGGMCNGLVALWGVGLVVAALALSFLAGLSGSVRPRERRIAAKTETRVTTTEAPPTTANRIRQISRVRHERVRAWVP